MEKITVKERVLRFVETKGTARFVEIQEFIVDTKYGKGTYANGYKLEQDWVKDKATGNYLPVMRRKNTNRGYFSSAFRKSAGRFIPQGYFLKGANRLVKTADGSYTTVREILTKN